ncbi:triacylglycerol lipase [Vibrio diabolicus]|jgi:pimeloyl-ACP methyl ester carboxylesterase|uniref:Cobinamide adenolsyltransferase n=1 Tax=Vibrio diabolicus TaxID=50719 RepID=A0AAX1XQG2_9VIBR|nr:triacylglycerol lipase [Vibrio diabolicus]MCG9621783.1 triacylglycerol lipase [Vibrio diabolicus]MCS0346674.1 triacylglycerol lipase [Vibrio diabolicus]MCS0361995.1 triacylglycerol lipase [Vibrio diabolicus]MCS0373329.1 triacylglycerol lipase [Vibrio diabolicus]MCS0428370.1 triacylglycerol lipase [Vibrio diabolicus]
MKIIILHGLYMHGLVMQPLSQKLRKLGYETQVLSYNTVAIDESSLFDSIDHSLNPLTANVLVGHSLGGLMIKRYLANRQPSTSLISHVVAIGSPLKGASIVGRIQDLGLGAILGNSPHHGLNKHDDAWAFPQKLGSIAGTMPIGARPLLIRNDNTMSDGTVTVEETRLDGMQDHIEVKQTHTSLIYNTFVPQQIDHFIRTDYFRR